MLTDGHVFLPKQYNLSFSIDRLKINTILLFIHLVDLKLFLITLRALDMLHYFICSVNIVTNCIQKESLFCQNHYHIISCVTLNNLFLIRIFISAHMSDPNNIIIHSLYFRSGTFLLLTVIPN